MGSERRRHPRITADLPFRILDEGGREEAFRLLDLSESGARIQCSHAIPAMTRIRVAMLLPGHRIGETADLRLDTTGVVVWSHAVEGGRFDTGVFFSELEDEQRTALTTFLRGA